MEILKTEFEGRGSQRGYKFSQLERVGNVALYQKSKDGHTTYEVIIIQQQQESTITLNGVEVYLESKELYPSDNQFGTLGFAISDFDRALIRFKEVLHGEIIKSSLSQ